MGHKSSGFIRAFYGGYVAAWSQPGGLTAGAETVGVSREGGWPSLVLYKGTWLKR